MKSRKSPDPAFTDSSNKFRCAAVVDAKKAEGMYPHDVDYVQSKGAASRQAIILVSSIPS